MSSKPTLKQLEKLARDLILPFHEIVRDISLPLKGHRADNDAEHSWALAFLACSLAPEIDPELDVGKIAQYAIAHDIVEVYAGDTSVWSKLEFRRTKAAREKRALEKIKKEHGRFRWISQIIEAYEAKSDNESRFVYALDKFWNLYVMYLDEGYYYKVNKLTKSRVKEVLHDHPKKAQAHPEVARYYEAMRQLFESKPHYFYQPHKQ
jgi:5'-deoxynucleotidase YfbR-like HD superfamily hydrolase